MNYERILRFALAQKPCIQATLENTTPEDAIFCRKYLETSTGAALEPGEDPKRKAKHLELHRRLHDHRRTGPV